MQAAVRIAAIRAEQQQTIDPRQRSGPTASPGNAGSRSDILHQTEQQIIDLRHRAASEKSPDKLRVYRRALAGVLVASAEAGDESLNAKDFAVARDYFQLATDADPDSVWALRGLATALAFDNDRKGTFKALRRAKEKSKDLAAFRCLA